MTYTYNMYMSLYKLAVDWDDYKSFRNDHLRPWGFHWI